MDRLPPGWKKIPEKGRGKCFPDGIFLSRVSGRETLERLTGGNVLAQGDLIETANEGLPVSSSTQHVDRSLACLLRRSARNGSSHGH